MDVSEFEGDKSVCIFCGEDIEVIRGRWATSLGYTECNPHAYKHSRFRHMGGGGGGGNEKVDNPAPGV